MEETKVYTQRSVVAELIGIEGTDIQFGKTITFTTEGSTGEKISLMVSKTNIMVKFDNEVYIFPFEKIVDFYVMAYSDKRIMINTKFIRLEINLKKTEKEEEE